MTQPPWGRLKALFQGALDQPPGEVRAWLRLAAGGDEDLIREAEALLQIHETAGDFLEQPVEVDPEDLVGPAEAGPYDSENDVGAGFSRPGIEPGTRLGSYVILEEIGRGGMGVVYLAEDERLKRHVAIKSLPAVAGRDAAPRERLRKEARAAATISHPGVATVYALEEIDDHILLVTEYIAGRTLRDEIDRGPIAAPRALKIVADIADALAAAHDAGVVHRDLKPENVLITHGGAIKVVDFGIAHIEGPGATRQTVSRTLRGTPAYMAPEQLVGGRVDARVDIYAAGLVLSEMIMGRHPMLAGPADRLRQSRVAPRPDQPALAGGSANADPPGAQEAGPYERGEGPYDNAQDVGAGFLGAPKLRRSEGGSRPDMPPRIAAIVARCRQLDPGARYGSARELLHAIEEIGSSAAAPRVAGDPRNPARWWWEFHQAVTALTYWLLVIPSWTARGVIGGSAGRAFFIITLGAVIVSSTLRLHLWFTSRFYPAELRWVRSRVRRAVQAADWLFVLALVAGGLMIGETRAPLAIVLVSFGIGTAVAFLVIERATKRAAFRSSSTRLS
jgi:serine/threonine protein kinase